jgi:hypothetical protein
MQLLSRLLSSARSCNSANAPQQKDPTPSSQARVPNRAAYLGGDTNEKSGAEMEVVTANPFAQTAGFIQFLFQLMCSDALG